MKNGSSLTESFDLSPTQYFIFSLYFSWIYFSIRSMSEHDGLSPSCWAAKKLMLELSLEEVKELEREMPEEYPSVTPEDLPTFHGRFHQSLLYSKKRAISHIWESRQLLKDRERCLLAKALSLLNGEQDELLQRGLFLLHIELNIVKQSEGLKSEYIQLINEVRQIFSPLLLFYFVEKEFRKSKMRIAQNNKLPCISLKNMISPRDPLEVISQDDQILYAKVEQEMQQHTLDSLLDLQLQDEEQKLCNSIEMCRLCGSAVELKKLQKHMKFCAKLAQLHEEQKKIETEKEQLRKQANQIEKQLLLRPLEELCPEQNLLLSIIKKFKNENINPRNKAARRRSSQSIGYKLVIVPPVQIQKQIQEYESLFGSDTFVQSLLNNRQAYLQNQKKLQSLERAKVFCSSGSENNGISSLQSIHDSLGKAIKNSINQKTKKSLFGEQDSISSKDSSISKASEESSKIITTQKQLNDAANLMLPSRTHKNLKLQQQQSVQIRPPTRRDKGWKTMIPCLDFVPEEQMSLEDFDILKFLGKGAFGEVYLVRRKKTADLYALKHIRIDDQSCQKKLDLIKNEQDIFKKIAGDHLVKAPFAFSNSSGYFFVLEFMPGGDFSEYLGRQVYLEEDEAKFYLAEIVLAIEHLHSSGIIHRDIKPENLVLDIDGHLKLTDFGLSQIKIRRKINNAKKTAGNVKPPTPLLKRISSISSTTQTTEKKPARRAALVRKNRQSKIIGTPDYIAPEIINQTSINNKSIDWWSLGVIAYQMLDNIIQGKMQWPQIGREEEMISPQAEDLIKKLLNKNFKARLGAESVEDIKKHPFFTGIDWQNIKKQTPPLTKSKPINMQLFKNMSPDPELFKKLSEKGERNENKIRSIKLENFVRYDLLVQQTYGEAEKNIQRGKSKIQRLRSFVSDLKENQNIDAVGGTFPGRSSYLALGGQKNSPTLRKTSKRAVCFKQFE